MKTDRSWRATELAQVALAAVLALAGMALALLPHAWIEERLGLELDGGSGVLEFLPVVFERFGFHKPLRWIHAISVPLMIAGVLLSTLHQSSLGTVYHLPANCSTLTGTRK